MAGRHLTAQPRRNPGGDPHGDAVLGAAHGRKGHMVAGLQCVGELGESSLIDQADRAPGGFPAEPRGGLDHSLVQALGQKEPEFLGILDHADCGHG